MKINRYKKILIIFIIAIYCIFGAKIYASTMNLSEKGTISVSLKNDGKIIKGAEITIYKVADIKIKDDNIEFLYNEPFKSFDVNINDINSDEAIKNLTQTALENNAKGITKATDETGKIEFSELEAGVYLVVQTKSVNNYYDFNSYLVKIPYNDNGVWKYNVNSEPKIEQKEEQSPNKPQDSNVAGDYDDEINKVPEKKEELIKTGQSNLPIFIFSFTGIICIIAGLIIITKRRNNEN